MGVIASRHCGTHRESSNWEISLDWACACKIEKNDRKECRKQLAQESGRRRKRKEVELEESEIRKLA